MHAWLRISLVSLACAGCAVSSGETCDLNSDCLEGTCVEGKCVQECRESELDCPIGYVCNPRGVCEYGGTGGPGTGGNGAGGNGQGGQGGALTTGSSGATTGTMTTTTGNSSTVSTGTGGMTLAELSLCGSDSECASGICRAMTPGGEQRCTKACSSHAQCGSGLRCEDPGGGQVCVRSDVGRSCVAAQQCNFACLTPQNYCVSTCNSGSDCPNGYGCMPVGSPATNVCVRAAADCASGTSQCVAPAACDTSPNLVVSSCTLACSSAADCPQRALPLPAWTCDGLCRRPSDVFGPLPGGFAPAQYACNAASQTVNVCGDGLHINFSTFTQPPPPAVNCSSPTTTDGIAGDACLDSCRLTGACPHGFGCAALAEVGGQRIGLCMPSGGGEVGAACSRHGDCAFSYCEGGLCSRDCSKDGLCPSGSQCVNAGGPNVEGLPFRRCE